MYDHIYIYVCKYILESIKNRIESTCEPCLRQVSLTPDRLQDAEEKLRELLEEERRRALLLAKVEEAIQQRELFKLKDALREARAELSHQELEPD